MKRLSWKCKLIAAAFAALVVPAPAFAQAETGSSEATAEPATAEPEADDEAADDSSEEGAAAETAEGQEKPKVGAEAEEKSASDQPLDGATYQVRLRDLELRVDELKEQIRRSHTRLSLLSDTILSGASGGARAEIEFVNDLSGAWHLVEAVFVLDGAVQYKKADDTGVLAKQKKIPIFSGSVPTGDHTLQVMLKLRGHGFGVFSYLRGMEASVTNDHSFTLTGGKVLELTVTAWEQGGPTTPVEEQPDIRFEQTIRSATEAPKAMPAKSTSSSTPKAGGTSKASTDTDAKDGKVGGGLSVGGGASDK